MYVSVLAPPLAVFFLSISYCKVWGLQNLCQNPTFIPSGLITMIILYTCNSLSIELDLSFLPSLVQILPYRVCNNYNNTNKQYKSETDKSSSPPKPPHCYLTGLPLRVIEIGSPLTLAPHTPWLPELMG